jgi:hypothetical protein
MHLRYYSVAQTMMSRLTGYGVNAVLPIVLTALSARAWRTKFESATVLGAMAFCAPKQLSQCLPLIVPRLLEAATDPHKKVVDAAQAALEQIGSVIGNPEILELVPTLLAALRDPSTKTQDALESLMQTAFIHAADPASLALILPILERGLAGRQVGTKKMAAQVAGSICGLVADVGDLAPYAPSLLRALKVILTDPVPDVRQVRYC